MRDEKIPGRIVRWWHRRRLHRLVRRYRRIRSRYDCGEQLAHHINPELTTIRAKIDAEIEWVESWLRYVPK